MKKTALFLTVLIFSTAIYCQQNDTIFFKSGDVLNVYEVIGFDGAVLKYIRNKDSRESVVDTTFVKRYGVKSAELKAEQKIMETELNAKQKIEDSKLKAKQKIYSIEKDYYEINKDKSQTEYRAEWVQYNLKGFYKQQRLSHIFYGISLLTGIPLLINGKIMDEKRKKTQDPAEIEDMTEKVKRNTNMYYLPGALGLAGFVIYLDSYKWIKRASILPSLNGLTLQLEL
jgi:hypothetical protein